MSVAVVITYRDDEAAGPTYLPVATEQVFASHWLPAAAALGLSWVPLFRSGVPVAVEDLPAVRAEIEELRDRFAQAEGGAGVGEHLRERSRWLAAELARLDPATILELFIG